MQFKISLAKNLNINPINLQALNCLKQLNCMNLYVGYIIFHENINML
jgi:hypothetical protein